MPELLAKIEAAVVATGGGGTKGVAVGSALSHADLCIYSILKEGFPAYREDTLAAAKDCPKLLEICKNCASNPNLSKWIKERPVTNMCNRRNPNCLPASMLTTHRFGFGDFLSIVEYLETTAYSRIFHR